MSFVRDWVDIQKKELQKATIGSTFVSNRFGRMLPTQTSARSFNEGRFGPSTVLAVSFTVVAAVGTSLYTLRHLQTQADEAPVVGEEEAADEIPPPANGEVEAELEERELRQARRLSSGRRLNM